MTERVARNPGSPWLVTGGVLSLAAAALHLACIPGGGDWYRFFGAGEGIARAAERGSLLPAAMATAIAAVLAGWGAYAFSGAGRVRRFPLLRTALVLISAVYLVRAAMVLAPDLWNRPDLSATFMLWSSAIVFIYGLAYAIGTWRAWPTLSNKEFA